MNKIRTTEELVDHIAQDITWRKRELSELWLLISSFSDTDLKQRIYIRCAIGFLYAHWEGFIKYCSTAFLEYLDSKKIKNEEMCSEIMALSLKRRLRKALTDNDARAYIDTVVKIRENNGSIFDINFKTAIETKDNLSSTELKKISNFLKIDYSLFATREKQIDDVLLHYRNNIVHGKNMELSKERYKELYQDVITLLETFRNCVENSATTKGYTT
jgi:hypothetical protein